ncbi:MAG: YcaO-like family protein [Desulfobacterales bacterium]|nr:YcaO-like family protein [Desulfobacterales bacterium]
MFNSLVRSYKERPATATIEFIRDILSRIDLVPDEIYHANPYPKIFSSSVALPSNRGGFRTNGKGRTQELSLASAYAEYMERMQNLLFATFSRSVAGKLKEEFGYYYFPDESYMDRQEVETLGSDILDDFFRYPGQDRDKFLTAYFDRIAANGMPGVVATPFYDTLHQDVQMLPLNILLLSVGSNGMAAGNTVPEALFQALCELTERWAAALVYYEQMTPPTVPDDFLAQFSGEYAIKKSVEKDGRYEVIIKDFSAGRGIPTLGVIIKNLESGKYRLNVGSETSFQVALSRCLTEIFQGIQNNEEFDAAMIDIPESVPDYFLKQDDEALNQRFHMFTQFTKDNSGVFPPSLFNESPTYQFDPETFTPGRSYREEVRRMVRFFHDNGKNVYIRDVSFLGFPSVFVYVPEFSAQGRKSAPPIDRSGRFQLVDLDSIEEFFFDIGDCSPDQLSVIAHRLESFEPSASVTQLFNIEMEEQSTWEQINVAFVLTQIYYSLGNYEQAHFHFKRFCVTRKELDPYYTLIKHYLEARCKGIDDNKLKSDLTSIAREEEIESDIVNQVIKDMAEPYLLKSKTKLPRCPNCNDCHLLDACQTRHKLTLARAVYSSMLEMPEIETLKWVSG